MENIWRLHGKEKLLVNSCERVRQGNILSYGVSVCDGSQHHALDDGAMLLFRQAAMGHQRGGQLGGRGGVNTLKPFVTLDLL